MSEGDRLVPSEREARRHCPVCESPTIDTLGRLRLYLGAKERCVECMAGWKFVWGRWLYHLPVAAILLVFLVGYLLFDYVFPDAVVLVAVGIAALVAPLMLPVEARFGDRLTEHAIRRQERRLEEEVAEPAE